MNDPECFLCGKPLSEHAEHDGQREYCVYTIARGLSKLLKWADDITRPIEKAILEITEKEGKDGR